MSSAGSGQVKKQALELKATDPVVSFNLKAEFRASESPWKKLTHRPKKQAESLCVPPSAAPWESGAKLDMSVRSSRMLAPRPMWQVFTAGASAMCRHRWLALSPSTRARGWSCPVGVLGVREVMGANQAILSILWWSGDSHFHFKWIFPSISTEVCVFLQTEKATAKGWMSLPQGLWSKR